MADSGGRDCFAAVFSQFTIFTPKENLGTLLKLLLHFPIDRFYKRTYPPILLENNLYFVVALRFMNNIVLVLVIMNNILLYPAKTAV